MLLDFTQYPSFIVFSAIAMSVVISLIITPIWKRILRRSHIGQQVRIDGPESHLVKQGTPTMGGVGMLVSLVLTITIMGIWSPHVVAILLTILAAGLLGFVDDAAKVIFHRSLGLGPIAKLVCQFTIASVFILYAVNCLDISPVVIIPFIVDLDLGVLKTTVPIFGGINIPWLYLILIDILLVGMCNACNLADGLDGLAAGSSVIIMIVMAAISYRADSLSCSIISAALGGACIGFLWHNAPPADIFMGDTGSLALGMSLGCLSVITKTEILAIVVGGMYVVEALSVMIQVFYYKRTKKRIFLMAPLHHHFEKKGWSETKVVVRFWIISGIMSSIGFAIYFSYTLLVNTGAV